MYYLGSDNCVYSAADITNKLVCGVSDFEVRVDGKIIALTDPITPAGNNGTFLQDPNSQAYYTKYNIYKGLTLLRDEPIFIDMNNIITGDYNSE